MRKITAKSSQTISNSWVEFLNLKIHRLFQRFRVEDRVDYSVIFHPIGFPSSIVFPTEIAISEAKSPKTAPEVRISAVRFLAHLKSEPSESPRKWWWKWMKGVCVYIYIHIIWYTYLGRICTYSVCVCLYIYIMVTPPPPGPSLSFCLWYLQQKNIYFLIVQLFVWFTYYHTSMVQFNSCFLAVPQLPPGYSAS